MRVCSPDLDSECRDVLAQAKAWTVPGSIPKHGDTRDEFYFGVSGISPACLV